MRLPPIALLVLSGAAILGACQTENAASAPGTAAEGFTDIAPAETIRFVGTEPFWGGSVSGTSLNYETPENIDGTKVAVKRFAGQGGLGYSGRLDGKAFDMTITPGSCSDGMSDRTFPFTVTLRIAQETRFGCAWTDAKPFEGPEDP